MRRLLVTGIAGFVGRTLAAMVERDPELREWTLCALPADFDVLDPAGVREVVAQNAPDAVIHLAAMSNVPGAFRDPGRTLRVNVLGTLNLLQALRETRFGGRMVYVGSGDVYGAVPEDRLPVGEDALPVPRNPYAVSKLAAEALCRQWVITERMAILLARPFNHIGPGQDPSFAVSAFARQVARIKLGLAAPVVEVGDLDVTRDFTDVRDVVRAYFRLLERGRPGTPYNVCSGREVRLGDLLRQLVERAGVEVELRVDPARVRAAEQRRVRGSAERLHADTGWRALVPLAVSLVSTYDDWLGKEGTDG